MTNHWRDIKNADLILINGANPAEAHPVGFQWFVAAKNDPKRGPGSGGGAKIIHADPRFTRTSAVADIYARIRTGTDVAYFGGLINYVLQNNLYHDEYVRNYTNASFLVKPAYAFKDGLFSGYDAANRKYDISSWGYQADDAGTAAATAAGLPTNGAVNGIAKRDMTLQDPQTVFQLMKQQYSRYTPEKVMPIVYAVGLTHHTTGGQLIRSGAVLQLLLGNMGRPGGGMNAERGHANIQGNTDNAISWELLPGYLRISAPGQQTVDDYVKASASKRSDPRSWNFFGINYRKFMVSLLKAWYGDAATKANEFAFNFIPKPAKNSSWMSIYDQALKGSMQGLILSGMTATSIGPDSNRVIQALGNLKWLVVMDPLPTTSSEFWYAPGVDPSSVKTEVFMMPTTHWIEKDGSFVNSGRWMQWKDQVIPPQGNARHDHWILADLFGRVKTLYQQQGGKFPDPILALTLKYNDATKPTLDEIAQEVNGFDLTTKTRMATFAALKDDGTTNAGNWIYTASYPAAGNLSARRAGLQDVKANDPTGMGFFPNWAWSWPLNRRVLYNRASADLNGNPWDPTRVGIKWDAVQKKWVGDVPDYPATGATADPKSPTSWLPFIMNGEGVGRLFSTSMVDGPLPEHYEPMEAPVKNPLHPSQSESPVAFIYTGGTGKYGKVTDTFGTVADYPYVATSYRLTEHEHYVTQHVPLLAGLQPSPFVEIPV